MQVEARGHQSCPLQSGQPPFPKARCWVLRWSRGKHEFGRQILATQPRLVAPV